MGVAPHVNFTGGTPSGESSMGSWLVFDLFMRGGSVKSSVPLGSSFKHDSSRRDLSVGKGGLDKSHILPYIHKMCTDYILCIILEQMSTAYIIALTMSICNDYSWLHNN